MPDVDNPSSQHNRNFTGTFFNSFAARAKQEFSKTPAELVDLIQTHHRAQKKDLHWIKLARFGELRTTKQSLRWNGNVLAITGVEADYDGEVISLDEAVRTLERWHIEAVVYTSPSHTEPKPRWRILAPLSQERAPQERERFLARLNGLFGGAIEAESFTLSQSYYYGFVENGAGSPDIPPPSHRAVHVAGEFIDTMDTLDQGAVGKRGGGGKGGNAFERFGEGASGERLDIAGAVAEIISGGGFHDTAKRLGAKLYGQGMGRTQVEPFLEGLRQAAMLQRPDLGARKSDVPRICDWLDEQEARKQGAPPETTPEPGTPSPPASVTRPITRNDFYAILSQNLCVFIPTREFCAKGAIESSLGRGAAPWIFRNRRVEQVTWAPGHPQIINDYVLAEGGFIPDPGNRILNTYRPPLPGGGDPGKAGPWLDHIRRIYPDDWQHIVHWCAQRVQLPHRKINHALVLGGAMGIGKDTLLEPVKRAVGHWNFIEVSPQHMLGRFNGFVKSVILRVSEARDLGDSDRFKFYDHMKALIAAPPDTLLVDEKHLKPYSIPNLTGIIITTNHKADGIYLPPDDRRHYVAWSQATEPEFDPGYWNALWGFYENGGFAHIAAHLHGFDLDGFDEKAPPIKTRAFFDIADASRAPEDGELADVIDRLGQPDALTLADLLRMAQGDILEWLRDRKNRRTVPHRLEKAGFVPVRNGLAKDGLWVVNGERKAVYARSDLSIQDQITAARHLVTKNEF